MNTPRPDEHRPSEHREEPARLAAVTRLNRNVLVVAAMGVAVVLLTVTHVARSGSRTVREAAPPRVETGAMADFLRTPAGAEDPPLIPPPAFPDEVPEFDAVPQSYGSIPSSSGWYDPFPAPDPREEAYERALRAGLRSGDFGPRGAGSGSTAMVGAFEPSVDELSSPPDRYREFMSAVREPAPTLYAEVRITEPVSDYQIMAGTVLPATTVTAMNSDMPGEIVAQVSRNIYDSQQQHLLIPRGTRIIGRYDNQIALGQSRVLIAWTRLIYPDGRSLSVPGLPTMDLRGAAGVRSRVDNRYDRLYGQAVLLSIISAGAQLSQPRQSGILAPPSAGQVAAGALGQQLSQVSMEMIRRNMDIRPTLEVRAGTPFYIFLERDLVLDGPYVDRRSVDGRSAPLGR